ncbi:MAG: glycosyltransferase [Chloroflexi bacterium]|nr:glycosyltransferase [Chloroflexota bacterium]
MGYHGPGTPTLRRILIRTLIVATVVLGLVYLTWRWTASLNPDAWPISIALVIAETYSFIGACLFGLTLWRELHRGEPPAAGNVTVDVFITCYNEPVELVRRTVKAAQAIRYPHQTYVLDDGDSASMRAMAQSEGAGYIVRTEDWRGRPRHAKAGNLNNALLQTRGELLLMLDADQVPEPGILDRTIGYFQDPRMAFVQTPQPFYNVPRGDPFGSEAPLFYGPIQQGKDGWNAAFFCGSNAVLRREALMQLGISRYVVELEQHLRRALTSADGLLRRAARNVDPADAVTRTAVAEMRSVVKEARAAHARKEPIQDITWSFQRRAQAVAQRMVAADLGRIRTELASIPGIDVSDVDLGMTAALDDDQVLHTLTTREMSPLAAIETVRGLLLAVDVDRSDQAQPVMPMSTISVTEDMATAMRLHARGWKSAYHHEMLACGLAPEDLRSALQQRLRWAQGTIQVMLRENPLAVRGLSLAQRLMYFSTMWSYLSGFVAAVYVAAPALYLFFGWLPIKAFSIEFFARLIPYLLLNQLLFVVAGWGIRTWRGQQYSLALFPLWMKAVSTACANVWFGQPLGFVVTPKTRQAGGAYVARLRLVGVQVLSMLILISAALWGLARLTMGFATDGVAVLVNVAWITYDLVMLSVVLDAAAYEPASHADATGLDDPESTAALAHGRALAARL